VRAIYINPYDKTITTVQVETDQVKELLQAERVAVTFFFNDRNHLVIGKDAIEKPGMRFWCFRHSPPIWRFPDSSPIAGPCLIRGNSCDGLQAEDCPLDEALVAQTVDFLDIAFDGWKKKGPKFRPLGKVGALTAG
jgi:hypothetical protein